MTLKGHYEILPYESDKKYKVTSTFTISYKGKSLTIVKDYEHDRYTFAPDLPDERPTIIHDFAYDYKIWDDGTPIIRSEADKMLRFFMLASQDEETRVCAERYYHFVRWFGWWGWYFKKVTNADPRSSS